MDEMRLKLSTKIMRNLVSKLLTKLIYKEYGYKVNIQLNDLDVWVINGDTTIKTNVELKIKSDDFMKIINKVSSD